MSICGDACVHAKGLGEREKPFHDSDSERVACQINYTVSEQKKISINDSLLHDTFFFFFWRVLGLKPAMAHRTTEPLFGNFFFLIPISILNGLLLLDDYFFLTRKISTYYGPGPPLHMHTCISRRK